MRSQEVLARIRSLADPAGVAALPRFGIRPAHAYGLSAPALHALAREIGRDHRLAQELWADGSLDARILAALVDEPERVTPGQMDRWARAFDSWAVCDACCVHLFSRSPFAHAKAVAWSDRPQEFVKRAGFALMAALAVHDNAAKDEAFLRFLPAIVRQAGDERNFVKKAVNWALRQIGKRNRRLNAAAIETALGLKALESKSARWIASDALRELQSPAVKRRLLARAR